jgi:hypothetical protein
VVHDLGVHPAVLLNLHCRNDMMSCSISFIWFIVNVNTPHVFSAAKEQTSIAAVLLCFGRQSVESQGRAGANFKPPVHMKLVA